MTNNSEYQINIFHVQSSSKPNFLLIIFFFLCRKGIAILSTNRDDINNNKKSFLTFIHLLLRLHHFQEPETDKNKEKQVKKDFLAVFGGKEDNAKDHLECLRLT